MEPTEIKDWRENKTFSECMLYMLENEIMCDVTFKVGKHEACIKAHKNILAGRSSEFNAVFEKNESSEIAVPDMDGLTFKDLLRWMYGNEIKLTMTTVQDLISGAEKYNLKQLTQDCFQFLQSISKSKDAALVLTVKSQGEMKELQRDSLQYIIYNASSCFSSDQSLNLNNEYMKKLLTSETLGCSETDLCKFLLKWLDNQCKLLSKEKTLENVQIIMKPLIPLIRFQYIDINYFTETLTREVFLTPDQIINVYRAYHGEINELSSQKARIPNLDRPTRTISRHATIQNPWENPMSGSSLKFLSNKDIWLKGISVYGSVGIPNVYGSRPFTIEIIDAHESIISCTRAEMPISAVTTHVVDLKPPILIMKNVYYTIVVKGFSLKTYYGVNCKTCCTDGNLSITFSKFKFVWKHHYCNTRAN